MKFPSFLHLLGQRGAKQLRRTRTPSRSGRGVGQLLRIEELETRELLATAPFIASVQPANGSTVTTLPLDMPNLIVTYSETMNLAEATDKANYALFASDGTSITIDSVSVLDGPANKQYQIAYNGGNGLPVDTYTLLVHGDKIHDTNDLLPLATGGQVVVANKTANSVSIVNVGANGSLSTLSNYPDPKAGGATTAVALANLSGQKDASNNPIPDLVVLNSGTDTVSIFRGRVGGGFDLTPTATLTLPSGAGASALVIGNLDSKTDTNGLPDIAVLDAASKNISVFINQRQFTGDLTFTNSGNFSADGAATPTLTPSGLVLADLDGDGVLDLATALTTADGSNNYNIATLQGNGDGTFATAKQTIVGNTGGTGVASPTTIAVGNLDADSKKDLVVGGTNGIAYLQNTSGGGISFAGSVMLPGYTSTPTSLAIGKINNDAINDVVALTAGSQDLQVWTSDGKASPTFTLATVATVVPAGSTGLALQDIDGDNDLDVLFVNNAAAGKFGTLVNKSTATVAFAAASTTYVVDGNPVRVAVGDTDQDGVADVVTANASTNNASLLLGNSDGTFRVANNVALGGTNPNPIYVVTGDLNADGVPDIVTVDKNLNRVSIIASDPANPGKYLAPSTLSTGNNTGPVAAAIGDIDNDGKMDIAVALQNTSKVRVFYGQTPATLTFTAVDYPSFGQLGSTPTGIVIADFNKDGRPDLAFSHNGSGKFSTRGVTYLEHDTTGTRNFKSPKELISGKFVSPPNASAIATGDFNRDSNIDIVVTDVQNNKVFLLRGDGKGNFTNVNPNGYTTVKAPTSLAVGDFNRDGFLDVVVSSSDSTTSENVGVLLNQLGNSFQNTINTSVFPSVALTNVMVTNFNGDLFPDVVVGVSGEFDNTTNPATALVARNNVFALVGVGDGSFKTPIPYQAGDPAVGAAVAGTPSFVGSTGDPLLVATTFTTGGSTVTANLVENGNFEARDLSGEQGNLVGWTTFREGQNSHGSWRPLKGTRTPLSLQNLQVPPPQGNYAVMLDQADLYPIGSVNPNDAPKPEDYAGGHVIYQDFTIPVGATKLTITYNLYVATQDATATDKFGNPDPSAPGVWSDVNAPGMNTLHYTQPGNQQVRIDIIDAAVTDLQTVAADAAGNPGVIANLFQTHQGDASTQPWQSYTVSSAITSDLLTNHQGETLRFRVAAANTLGRVLVGLDDLKIQVTYNDTEGPSISDLRLRNPGLGASPGLLGNTSDPTVTGKLGDNGSVNNLSRIDFRATDPFGNVTNASTTTWDADGNFSYTLPIQGSGKYDVVMTVTDKAGNTTKQSFSFIMQGPSTTTWEAQGPGPIDVSNTGVDYNTVSGRVNAVVVDPSDTTGNTYYIASTNGGVWKTTDGGKDWTPLMDDLRDSTGTPVAPSVGALAMAPHNPDTLYAGLGVADNGLDSRSGSGVYRTDDGGLTWTVVSDSATVFAGARIAKIQVDATDPNRVYALVSQGTGTTKPGLYKSEKIGGVQTNWVNVLDPAKMTDPTSGVLGAGATLATPTDFFIDPFDPQDLWVGLGNIGFGAAQSNAGIWRSFTGGSSWTKVIGGDRLAPPPGILPVPNSLAPSGVTVGRVTLAQAFSRLGNELVVYALVGTVPTLPNAAGTYNHGSFAALYKTEDTGLDWTKIQLKEQAFGTYNFTNINLLGGEATDVGALIVDPNNANILYVGGSDRFSPNTTNHGIIRVDTSNLRDTNYVDPITGAIPNDGDDITWAQFSETNYDNAGSAKTGYFPDDSTAYSGVGAFWTDLETGANNGGGNQQRLPASIHALAFDPVGRLVVGTELGVYRGVGYSFDAATSQLLDSSGRFSPPNSPAGPLFGTPPGGTPSGGSNPTRFFIATRTQSDGQGMTFKDINGNLQISSLTSVAIDPQIAGVFYTSQISTGTARTDGSLTWSSMGLTGPTDPTSGNLGIPTGAYVRAALPLTAGDPSQIFRSWAFLRTGSLIPELSLDGGQSFTAVQSGGISINAIAGVYPPLAINPNKVDLGGGVLGNEVLLGTDRVYRTRTGVVWGDISNGPLNPASFISAIAFGAPIIVDPSNRSLDIETYYAGLNNGEVYVSLDNGGTWVKRISGLPVGDRINGITTDPNDPLTAYVMVAGLGHGHVFKTSDGGVSWTDISQNLPNVPAYAMVIDQASGRYFVGTDVGVYTATDFTNPLAWSKLGVGLPSVPVVDLQFDATSHTLAAATQGRGLFTLSTDTVGPRVVSAVADNATGQPLTSITITFNEAIDTRTFTTLADERARTQAISGILAGTEYRTLLVNGWYNDFFGNGPTTAQLNSALAAFGTDEQVIAKILGGTDFYDDPALGNSDPATWASKIYPLLVGRNASNAEKNEIADQITNQGKTPEQVALAVVLDTDEYRTIVATAAYNNILKRPPTALELSGAVDDLGQGFTTAEGLIAKLLGSVEYYTKNGSAIYIDSNTATATLDAGAMPTDVQFADIDNDGTDDMVVANSGTHSVYVYLGQAGGFTFGGSLAFPATETGDQRLVIDNFTGGAAKDIVVANAGTNTITFFKNNSTPGTVSFATGVDTALPSSTNPTRIVSGDFDFNGTIDVAVLGPSKLAVLKGDGAGNFGSAVTPTVTGTLTSLAVGSLNGDTKPDLMVAGSAGVRVLLNATATAGGAITFTSGIVTGTAATAPVSVAVGDLDGDGIFDIAYTTDQNGGQVRFLQNDGSPTPTFTLLATVANAGTAPRGIVLRDLDGDQKDEVLLVNSTTAGTLTVIKNTTDLVGVSFGPAVSYSVDATPTRLAVTDTNQDGLLDVAVANSGSDSVWVLLGLQGPYLKTPTDNQFLDNAYKDVLGRPIQTTELNAALPALRDAEQLRLTTYNGQITAPLAIVDLDPTTHKQFRVFFAPQVFGGTYSLTVGPNTLGTSPADLTLNPMDQNGDGVNGQNPADQSTTSFTVQGPTGPGAPPTGGGGGGIPTPVTNEAAGLVIQATAPKTKKKKGAGSANTSQRKKKWTQYATITNLTGADVIGPLVLVATVFSKKTQLRTIDGFTAGGVPYRFVVPDVLPAGGSVTVLLQYSSKKKPLVGLSLGSPDGA